MNKIETNEILAVMVDVQEKLLPNMYEKEELEEKIIKLCKGLQLLNIPILVSQQYTKGLKNTVESIKETIANFQYIEKLSFSVFKNLDFKNEIKNYKAKKIILFGIETHICILQSALDFLAAGYEVYIVCDCISSRNKYDKKIALKRLVQSGCILTTYESILFELLESSENKVFKNISEIVK